MAGSIKVAGHELVSHDIANDNLITGSGFPADHVVQVEYDNDFTAQNTTASFVDYLQINITPKKSGNLIFITATIATYHLSSGTVITAKLVRDSTNLNYEIADFYNSTGSGLPGNISFTFIDNPTIPSTPISINYKIQIKHESGSGKTNTDFNGSLNGVSSLVVMEIQQ